MWLEHWFSQGSLAKKCASFWSGESHWTFCWLQYGAFLSVGDIQNT